MITEAEAYALRAQGHNIERRAKGGNDIWGPVPDMPEWEYRERPKVLFECWANVYPTRCGDLRPQISQYFTKEEAESNRNLTGRTIKVREVEEGNE